MHSTKKNLFYINKLISFLKKNKNKDEIPVAAMLLYKNEIISIKYNGTNLRNSRLAHAEILVMEELKNYFISNIYADIILFTSLEPCLMCVGAAIALGIKIIYYGCRSFDWGYHSFHNFQIQNISVIPLLAKEEEIKKIIKNYFERKREHSKFING